MKITYLLNLSIPKNFKTQSLKKSLKNHKIYIKISPSPLPSTPLPNIRYRKIRIFLFPIAKPKPQNPNPTIPLIFAQIFAQIQTPIPILQTLTKSPI